MSTFEEIPGPIDRQLPARPRGRIVATPDFWLVRLLAPAPGRGARPH
jgi:hypothetical protein